MSQDNRRGWHRLLFRAVVIASIMFATGAIAWQQLASAPAKPDHYSRVAVEIQRAKAAGLTEVTLLPPIVMPTGVANVDELIRSYSLLRVAVVDAATLVGDQDVETWYKLNVLEVLSRQRDIVEQELPPVPARLLPLTDTEVLYPSTGGTAVIDGITVRERPVEAGLMLRTDRQYLGGFFLEFSGRIAEPAALAAALYEIDGDELKPQGAQQNPLVKDFRDYLGGRMSALQATILRQVGAPNNRLR